METHKNNPIHINFQQSRVHNGDAILHPATAQKLFRELSKELKIKIPQRHWKVFVSRRYTNQTEIEKVLKRYKVFGDLGYGGH